MSKEIKKQFSRWRELLCVLFGHNWLIYGSTIDQSPTNKGNVLEEYNECDYCGLEKHDRSGHQKKAFREIRTGPRHD